MSRKIYAYFWADQLVCPIQWVTTWLKPINGLGWPNPPNPILGHHFAVLHLQQEFLEVSFCHCRLQKRSSTHQHNQKTKTTRTWVVCGCISIFSQTLSSTKVMSAAGFNSFIFLSLYYHLELDNVMTYGHNLIFGMRYCGDIWHFLLFSLSNIAHVAITSSD